MTLTKTADTKKICQTWLRIMANPRYLAIARTAVKRVALELGINTDSTDSIVLAVEEALTNVIRHAYGGHCDELIDINFNKVISPDSDRVAIEILIRDYGNQVPLEKIKSRDLEEIMPGGIGVHIIQSIMDECEFYHSEDGIGTFLQLTKYVKLENTK